MSGLVIRLLGPFQTTLDNEPVTRFETEKVRALLAYLAVEADQSHRREFLAEMFWPNRPEGAARANLRHALGVLRTATGDRQRSRESETNAPFLLITRETIQFNLESNASVDTAAFTRMLQCVTPSAQPLIGQLEEAMEIYRGCFLEDISVKDSATFQEWVLLKREHFRRQALNALYRLAKWYEMCGRYGRSLELIWRQLELAPLDEEAHQQAMRLLALAGKRGAALAQYSACRRALAEELGVEPGAETTELYEQIRKDELEAPTVSSSLNLDQQLLFQRPGFLEEQDLESETPVFVAKEQELERLFTFLEQALKGSGRVVFVTGGPGRGKTALLSEFARRAMDAHPDLLVVSGNCNAYSGAGDPYLPFRDVMAMLTGDLQARWAAGLITRDHALRLWDALTLMVQTLVESGSSLFDTVITAEALFSRVAAALSNRIDLLERLQALIEQSRISSITLEQSHLFEHYSNVLRALADHHPLVLVLDDMQWADTASIGLLFHLGRRLANIGSRILIACAYRPEEVALGRAGQRHPLEKVLSEFKRTFGDTWVDLNRAEQQANRRFVNAFLDTQSNRLGEEFRAALFQHTEGHPLFTIELLRSMQERGDLIRDTIADGAWIEGPALDWERLPARVEAVIEQRINRLNPELQEVIIVASVEGEVFTAQVVAEVQKIKERSLLHQLSGELERRHRLVKEQEELQVGVGRINRYKFGHVLIQNYLYNRLGRGERRKLHWEVATALETLYGGQLDEIAVQLAHHYYNASDYGCALPYATRAAQIAARKYANVEAISHYTHAIEMAGKVSLDAISVAQLHRERGLVYETLGEFERSRADYEAAMQAARAFDVHLVEWRALLDLGKLWASRDYNRTRDYFRLALNLAQQMDDPAVLASSLNRMGNWYVNAENPQRAVSYHREALAIYKEIGDRRDLANTLDLLGITNLLGTNPKASAGYFDRAIALFRELDDRPGLASSLTGRGNIGGAGLISLTMVPVTAPLEAWRDFEEAIQIAQDIDSPAGEAWALWSLSLLNTVQGHFGQALEAAQCGLCIATEIKHREWMAGNRFALGSLYCDLFAPEEAQKHLKQALKLGKELCSQYWINIITGRLTEVQCLLDDMTQAQTYLETVITPQTPMDTMGKRYCWARRAELALSQGDPTLALEIANQLIASAPGMTSGQVITFLWKLRAEALAATGHTEEAHSLLRAAIENAQVTGEQFLLWRVYASLGRLFITMGLQSAAEEEFSIACRLIEELAATAPNKSLKHSFREGAYGSLRTSP